MAAPNNEITDLVEAPPLGKKSVLFFWASWHEPSNTDGAIDMIFHALASNTSSSVGFFRIEAEAVPELSKKYGVTIVPTFVLLNESGDIIERIEGGDDVARLTQSVSSLALSSTITLPTTSEHPINNDNDNANPPSLDDRLKYLTTSSEVILFMKGTPTKPRCGFSRKAIDLLTKSDIIFTTFDILSDEDVRQGLKTFSNWPTYPQLYVRGEFMGGLDIMQDMAGQDSSTNLAKELGVEPSSSEKKQEEKQQSEEKTEMTLEEKLSKLVRRQRVMLFMKGLPSEPKCGFSRQMVELLQGEGVSYDSFDILSDDEVRQGLKRFSNWPTYPQLYVDGDLIGGLDIVKDMKDSGELTDLLKA